MCIKSLKIKEDLYFNCMPITVPTEVDIKESEPQHQFLIFDRSGSMYGYLNKIMDVAIEYCKALPNDSTVSVGYFSSKGDYNLSVPFTLKKEIDGVTKILNGYRKALGLTNFIEILNKVTETASKLNHKSSLFFFTDGCHNDGGGRKQIEDVLLEWNKYSNISMFVGHGYIDREMMSWMASISNGSFVHLDSFNNIDKLLSDFGVSVEDSNPSIPITIDVDEDIRPISISGRSTIEYSVTDKTINYKPSKKGFKCVYFITKNKPESAVDVLDLDVVLERGIRAISYIYSQKNDSNTSLELLNYIGDKYLVRNLYNSITPDEFSYIETKIKKSIFSTKERYLEGTVKNYLPDPNAFCVMDAIKILMDDESIKMHIYDSDMEYTSISRHTIKKDGPSIKYPDDVSVYLNNIVFNKDRLNVSISTTTDGTVDLLSDKFVVNPSSVDELKKIGLDPIQSVNVFRTFNIIADGKVNTKKIVVSNPSKDTINKLSTILNRRNDDKYIIDFSELPIINKSYVTMTSAKTLANLLWEEKVLSDSLSVYTYLKKKIEEESGVVKSTDVTLTDEQSKYLFDHFYIKNKSYNPPVELQEITDEYEVYSFDIKINGYSKATASAVIEKINKGKSVTGRELIIEEAYKNSLLITDVEDKLKSYTDEISKIKSKLSGVRKTIQTSKLAIILSNKGKMDEFDNRENMVLDVDVSSINNQPLKPSFEFIIEKIKVGI